MSTLDYLKHLLVRTPLEQPAQKMRSVLKLKKHLQHPELAEIYKEDSRIQQAIERIVQPSSNCIDIGCHLGSTLSEIIRLSPHGKHLAFEPIFYKANWLRKKFPEVEVREVALSDQVGEVTFYVNSSRSGFSGLKTHGSKDDSFDAVKVQQDRLDDFLPLDYRVDFVKIDVEGAELAVFRGAAKSLSRWKPIILFECTRSGLRRFDYTPEQMFDFLTQQNSYLVFLLKDFLENGKALSFEQFEKALHYPFQAFNFMALPA